VGKEAIAMKFDDAKLLKPTGRQAGDVALGESKQSTSENHGFLSPDGYLVRLLLHRLGNPPLRFTLWTGESAAGGGRTVGG
jgi:hypothetical protein